MAKGKKQPEPKPKRITQYLIEQLATQLVVEERERCRVLDKEEKRNTADDIEYVGLCTITHIENCELQNEIIRFIEKMCRIRPKHPR
jgi:hypothetical protein